MSTPYLSIRDGLGIHWYTLLLGGEVDFPKGSLLDETGNVLSTSIPLKVGNLPLCLLYTSDAADEEDSVDLGGRRIIKKKKKKKVKSKREVKRIDKEKELYTYKNM
eukprot:TRINITY_DN7952_c0_g1_i18.p1 TRINITY_DN7952_c0_g1~~TRINITY_DN7952_c0_g1_i18.p1  ORF type:complete len:106 (-),score=19.39 TRINITY_DN7952_c0_g1_i18:41-358(-)